MTLLEGVERAMHATAKRHNQLVELEKKKEEEEEEEEGEGGEGGKSGLRGDGEAEGGGKSLSRHSSRVISRQTSWAERKRRQSFSRKK